MGDTEHFFLDGSYGAPGRRLRESETLRRDIEALAVSLWSDPGDRAETDAVLEGMKARLRFLEEHPEEDRPL